MEQPLDEDTQHTAGLSQLEDTFVSAEEVFNLIINLNTDKASGPDGLCSREHHSCIILGLCYS